MNFDNFDYFKEFDDLKVRLLLRQLLLINQLLR